MGISAISILYFAYNIYSYRSDLIKFEKDLLAEVDGDDKELKKQFNDFEIQTIGEGLAEIYNDNSVFIEESNFGRLLMLDQNGEIIWEYINRSKTNNKLYRLNWSRVINLNLQIFKKELDKQNDCKK